MWIRRIMKAMGRPVPPVVPVIRLAGVIGPGGAFRPSVNLASLAGVIERAFSVPDRAAVALAINSPGGSPVQSALVAGRIRQLADERGVPVFAFAEDVAASGGYWLACAADEIYADEASIIGSIGVVSAGFGFQDLLGRLGVERRVHTSGERKAMLDPFRPEVPEDVARLHDVRMNLHEKGALAFSVLSFALVAVPLGIQTRRKETSANLGIALGMMLVFYFGLTAVSWLGRRPELHPELLLWVPNLAFQLTGAWMWWQLGRN